MNTRKSFRWVLAVVLPLAMMLSITTAFADNRIDIDVSSACVINPGNDSLSNRILFKFDLPSKLSDKRIDYAEIIFKTEVDTLSRYSLMFAGYPLTKDWDKSTASWSNLWANEGGDHNNSIYETGLIKATSDGGVRFEITRLVSAWHRGLMPNYGLIIIPLIGERRITKLANLEDFPQGIFARVTIYFSYTHP